MNYKAYLNKNLHVLVHCTKSIFKNYFFLAILFIILVETIVYCVLMDSYQSLNVNQYLSKTKTLHQIYLVIDFVFIGAINLALVNILFSQHIKSGLYSIEKKAGIKSREIFLDRFLLIFVISFLLITILMILKLLSLLGGNDNRTYVTVDKIMFAYLANIIFNLLIINVLVMGYFLLNRVIAIFIMVIFITANVVSPFIFNMNYVGTLSNSQKLKDLRDETSTNAKLYLGNEFSKFISENEEYKFLVDEYDELNVIRDNPSEQMDWELFERIFYFGDIKNEEVYERLNHESNTVEFINAISNEYKSKTKTCNWDQLMFNKPNNSICEPTNFLENAIDSNISNGKYNKLFEYFKNKFDNFFLINEMSNSTSWKSVKLTGTIFEYGLFDKKGEVNIGSFKHNYVDPGEVTFYWMLFQTLRYSITLDSEQIRTLYKEQPNFKSYTVFNIFNYLPYIYNGSSIENKILDDVYGVNGISFVQTPKYSYTVNMNNDFKQYSANSGKPSDIRFNENRVSSNELKTINVKEYQTTLNYALITSLLSLIVMCISLLSYLAYRRIWSL